MASRGKDYGEKIVALFPAVDAAERAIVELRRLGIRDADMRVALPKPLNGRDLDTLSAGKEIAQPPGGLAGILESTGIGGGVAGTIEALGFAKDTARTYAQRVDAGAVLLAVKCGSLAERVRMAFDKFGAFDVRTSSPRTAAYGGSGYVPGPAPEIIGDPTIGNDALTT